MSAKTKSISTRLMVFTGGFTFLLFIGFWTVMYFSLKHTLLKQDQLVLADRIHTIQTLIEEEHGPSNRLHTRVEKEWFGRNFERIFVRVLDSNRKVVTQTPDLAVEHADVLDRLESLDKSGFLNRVESGPNVYQTAVSEAFSGRGGERYLIEAAIERTNEQSLLTNFRRFFWLLLVIGGLVSLWTSGAIVRIALQPIRQITTLAAGVNSERLDERIHLDSLPLELRELGFTMNHMLDRLRESFGRLSKFSEDMAHELRTPVNNLLGSMTVALNRDRTASDYRNLVGSSIEECERLKRIIDSLLFIARTADPDLKIQKQNLELETEIRDIVSFYQLSAEEKNIQIEMCSKGPISVKAERTLLQRCVGNLLSNSIRHSSASSKILLNLSRENDWVNIQVRDFGSGIPRQALNQIGDRFFKVDPSRSQANGGTGLGLSIVKGILNIHGGTMQVESEIAQGTTVTLRFPG